MQHVCCQRCTFCTCVHNTRTKETMAACTSGAIQSGKACEAHRLVTVKTTFVTQALDMHMLICCKLAQICWNSHYSMIDASTRIFLMRAECSCERRTFTVKPWHTMIQRIATKYTYMKMNSRCTHSSVSTCHNGTAAPLCWRGLTKSTWTFRYTSNLCTLKYRSKIWWLPRSTPIHT